MRANTVRGAKKERGKILLRATIWPRWRTIYDRAYSMSSRYCIAKELIINGHILIMMAKLKYEYSCALVGS